MRPEESLEALQRSLLTSAYEKLTPGGVLVYSLCTFRDAETDTMVHWMLDEHTDLEVVEPQLHQMHRSTWSRRPVLDTHVSELGRTETDATHFSGWLFSVVYIESTRAFFLRDH